MPEAHVACLRDARAGHDDARGRAHVRARRDAAPDRRPARAARPRHGARARSPTRARRARTRARSAAAARALARARRPRHRAPTSRAYAASLGQAGRDAVGSERRFLTRGGLSGVPRDARAACRRSPASPRPSASSRSSRALDGAARPGDAHDESRRRRRDGNACVLTTSLGLGSGDWLPGLDLHLNSMLGEADLLRGPLEPGRRMESMMAPTLVFDGAELELAIGAAGGTRLRTALVTVAAGILDEGLEPQVGRRPPARPRRRRRRERRAGRRRGGPRAPRGGGPCRPPLAGAAPLLRRRQRSGCNGSSGRPAAERRRARGSRGRLTGIQPT